MNVISVHCPACLFSFDSIKYFISHLRYFTSLEDNLHCNAKYKCEKCSYEAIGNKDFYFHLKQHYEYINEESIESFVSTRVRCFSCFNLL